MKCVILHRHDAVYRIIGPTPDGKLVVENCERQQRVVDVQAMQQEGFDAAEALQVIKGNGEIMFVIPTYNGNGDMTGTTWFSREGRI